MHPSGGVLQQLQLKHTSGFSLPQLAGLESITTSMLGQCILPIWHYTGPRFLCPGWRPWSRRVPPAGSGCAAAARRSAVALDGSTGSACRVPGIACCIPGSAYSAYPASATPHRAGCRPGMRTAQAGAASAATHPRDAVHVAFDVLHRVPVAAWGGGARQQVQLHSCTCPAMVDVVASGPRRRIAVVLML